MAARRGPRRSSERAKADRDRQVRIDKLLADHARAVEKGRPDKAAAVAKLLDTQYSVKVPATPAAD